MAARVRRSVAHAQASLNAARWSRFQRTVAATVDRVVLCSDLDAERSQLPNVAVVPNGYQAPALPLGRTQVGNRPTLLLAGSFGYPPNADAAQFLVADVWPRIRERRPDTTLRLVGEPSDSVTGLDQAPGVCLVGCVTTMDGELARADIVVVPLRYGSGTRLKILEAAAHRIPVVSTTIGAEGLGFEDNRHLLIADDAVTFAAACLRLLEDPILRQRLADEAEKAFLTDYQWQGARQRITTLVRAVAHQAESSS
jgi:glycosyltransferase involved in cell wall biosynthesis